MPSGIWIHSSEGDWVDTGIDWTDEKVDSIVTELGLAIIALRQQPAEVKAQISELVRRSIRASSY